MSTTYTLTLNARADREQADMLMASLVNTIDVHCIVENASAARLGGTEYRNIRVTFSAAGDAEADQISRDALAAAPRYVTLDAVKVMTGRGTARRAVATI